MNTIFLIFFVFALSDITTLTLRGLWQVEEDRLFAALFLVLSVDVTEEIGHGLLIVRAANGFRDEQAYVDGFDFVTLHLLYVVRHGVGDDDFVDVRVVDDARRV